jgi:hypothetical protein
MTDTSVTENKKADRPPPSDVREDPAAKSPLLRRIERRSWWILGTMVVLSAALLPGRFTAGVALGGTLSIAGFITLQGMVRRLLRMPAYKARLNIVIYHYLRLGLLFGLLAAILALGFADPLALVLGLSVVVISLLLTTVVDLRKIRLGV